MTQITKRRLFDAPTDAVWAVITDPDVYAAVAPNLSSVTILGGDGEGMVRECIDTDGNAWTESCTHWDEGRAFAVAVDVETSDFHRPWFARFEGTWSVDEGADGALVSMAFDFDTKYGPLGWLLGRYLTFKAGPLVEAIFDGWAAELDARLNDREPSATANASTDDRHTNRLYR